MTARLFTIVNSSLETTLTWRSLLPREEWTGWTTAGEDSGTAGTGLEAEGEITAETAGGSVEAVVEAETLDLRETDLEAADLVAAAGRGQSEMRGMGVTERGSKRSFRNICESLIFVLCFCNLSFLLPRINKTSLNQYSHAYS